MGRVPRSHGLEADHGKVGLGALLHEAVHNEPELPGGVSLRRFHLEYFMLTLLLQTEAFERSLIGGRTHDRHIHGWNWGLLGRAGIP